MMCDVVSRVDPDFKVHGHVKVEVRNNDGSLAQCEEHDNYVSPFVYGALRKVTNSRFMQLQHVDNTSTTVTTGLANIHNSIYMDKGLNTGLTLTDYAGVANERERVIHGNALAYGGYGASSSANDKGSFNPAESYQRANSQRFVYDFSTTQANGSFQSVYTTMQSENLTYIYKSPLLYISNKNVTPGVVNDGMTLIYGQNNGVTIMTVDEFINWLQGGTAVSTDHPLREFNNYNSRIALRQGELWWAPSSARYVYHAPLSDLANPTKVTTANNVSSICWHPKRDTFFTREYVSGTSKLVEYSTAFAQLRTFDIPSTPTSSNDLAALPEEDSIIIGGQVFDIDDNTNMLQPRQKWFATYANNSFHGCFMGDFLLDNYYLGLDLGTQYFSRARLDNPVTKNSRQTMKITYDFTMPPIEWDN
jgi:hypothetical protein